MNIAWVSEALPYLPTADGFRIQGGNLIPLLARRHRIDLISLLHPGDETHLDWARRYCAWIETIPVGRASFPMRLGNFVSGYLWGKNLIRRKELNALLRRGLNQRHWDILHVEGGFVAGLIPEGFPVPKILAVHDAEVLRARDMLHLKSTPLAHLKCLIRRYHEPRYDCLVYPRFLECVMVSERDAAFNRELVPKARFCAITNGTDCSYFRPLALEKDTQSVVFHGNLNYPPNVEAATEFANKILPVIRRKDPEVVFHIVGANPVRSIERLTGQPGIRLSSNPRDIRPLLCSASVYVCALRHGTGIKNKILEAMASELPIVCYEESTVGIGCTHGKHLLVARDGTDFASKVLELLYNPERRRAISKAGREFVVRNFSWESRATAYEQIYERAATEKKSSLALSMVAS